MEASGCFVSLMDALNVDESVVDDRLEVLMSRSTFTEDHLKRAMLFLQYKVLLNTYENCDSENNNEMEFAFKLIGLQDYSLKEQTCIIVKYALLLNKSTLETNAQHILQQILYGLDLCSIAKIDTIERNKLLFSLVIIDSVLDAAILSSFKLFIGFTDIPVENIMFSEDAEVRNHFITKTVIGLIEAVDGLNILDRIWYSVCARDAIFLKKGLIAVSSLSDYYLPKREANGVLKYQSSIVRKHFFWRLIWEGLTSEETFNRRCSLYLAKRAIDCISSENIDIHVKSEDGNVLFSWKQNDSIHLKSMWQSFFILMETLEEKQSNIVQSGLVLFKEISDLDIHWKNCVFALALIHPNQSVMLSCVKLKLASGIRSEEDALAVLKAINDTNLYDNSKECTEFLKALSDVFIEDVAQLLFVLKAVPKVKWLPVPLFSVTEIISLISVMKPIRESNMKDLFVNIVQMPCNSPILADAICSNIMMFICRNSCTNIESLIQISQLNQFDYILNTELRTNVFKWIAECMSCGKKEDIWNLMSTYASATSILLAYVAELKQTEKEEIQTFEFVIREKINCIKDTIDRPYANKTQCLQDLLFLCEILNRRAVLKLHSFYINFQSCFKIIDSEIESLVTFMACSLPDLRTIEQTDIVLKCASTLEKYNVNYYTKYDLPEFPKFYITNLHFLAIIGNEYEKLPQMCHLKLHIMSKISAMLLKDETNEQRQIGKTRNKFNEMACEIVYDTVTFKCNQNWPLLAISHFLYEMLDSGDELCLLWVLKIYKMILVHICKEDSTHLRPDNFIPRIWKEVRDIRSNALCKPCMKEFIAIILNKELLLNEQSQEVVLHYCKIITENSAVSDAPLMYLVDNVFDQSKEDIHNYEPLIHILVDAVLCSRIISKEQRITIEKIQHIENNPSRFSCVDLHNSDHFKDNEIRMKASTILTKLQSNSEVLGKVLLDIQARVAATFKRRTRYHANSQPHMLLQHALTHTLASALTCSERDLKDTVLFYVRLLQILPHQPNIRIHIEILVAFYIIFKDQTLNEGVLEDLELKSVPLPSMFMIIYLVMKTKITHFASSQEEYEYSMNLLLSHTMGQQFNVRLNAQYYSLKLYETAHNTNVEWPRQYEIAVKFIRHTFEQSRNEKSLLKLQKCYFSNDFDVKDDLTMARIYNGLDSGYNVGTGYESATVDEANSLDIATIQKKYIPWTHMFYGEDACIVNVKKNMKQSGLIVVASLVDKPPNLGGLARTSEVFGVRKYIIDNLKHLDDKNFQGLSVSAEKWVDIEQVRPGRDLKQYLQRVKTEGYTVVAAEQTSSSVSLHTFPFPHNTVLVLGHEKEGIPCDLLPYMDQCVEIPQRGCVRSLNVHVTAAIFIWEYVRQHLL